MDKKRALEEVAEQVRKCQRCPLYKQASQGVPGEGNPDAEIMFIGEGPGFHENQKGIPFCGAAGKLLDQLLQSTKVKREEVFIGNVVKHRPPGNRDPLPEEIEACKIWLDKQIEIIQPKIIVTLGRFSMAKFIPDGKISQIHGQARFVNFQGKRYIIIPMFHPAAALRGAEVMVKIKEDFLKIPKFLEAQIQPMETNLTNTNQGNAKIQKDKQLSLNF